MAILRLRGSFSLPKPGNAPEEYEDALDWVGDREKGTVCVLAVADGATESCYAKEWANILVSAFTHRPFLNQGRPRQRRVVGWLASPRRRFQEFLAGRSLPWHAARKVRAGSQAAFLGLTGRGLRRDGYEACVVAMGDTCLLVVRVTSRGARLVECFPIRSPARFPRRPHLMSSLGHDAAELQAHLTYLRLRLKKGTHLLAVTDALALTLMSWPQELQAALALDTDEDFLRFVERLRESRGMVDDDYTLAHLTVDSSRVKRRWAPSSQAVVRPDFGGRGDGS